MTDLEIYRYIYGLLTTTYIERIVSVDNNFNKVVTITTGSNLDRLINILDDIEKNLDELKATKTELKKNYSNLFTTP